MEAKDTLVLGGLAAAGIGGYFLWKYLQKPTPPPAEGVDITNIKII